MADKKISQLTDGTSFQAGDEAVVNRSGTNYKVDPTQFQTLDVKGGDVSFYEATGTTPKFFWDASAESLGIGTASPAGALHIDGTGGTSNTTSQLRFSLGGVTEGIFGVASSDNNVISGSTQGDTLVRNDGGNIHFSTDSGTSIAATIDSSGNVGIGTSSPGGRFQVEHDTNGRARAYVSNPNTGASTTAFMYAITTGNRYLSFLVGGANRTGTTAGLSNASLAELQGGGDNSALLINQSGLKPIVFANNNTERARIDSSGNVGIGTSSPAQKLDVAGNIRVKNGALGFILGPTGEMLIGEDGSGLYIGGGFGVTPAIPIKIGSSGTTQIEFKSGGSEAMRIDSSGNLLVGKTATTAAGALISGGQIQGTVTGAASATFQAWNQATSGDNLFVDFYTEGGSGTQRGSIDYNRTGGLVRYNITSDYRAKDIIGPVQNTGATIDALKVYEGKMKGATQSRPMLIAHEAQEQAPYAVSGTKDAVNEDGTPDYQQIDHSSLVPLLIAEIQSLRARVAQLEGA